MDLPGSNPGVERPTRAIAQLIATKGEVAAWLAGRRPTIQAAIANKQMIAGMTEEDLVAAMGAPQRIYRDEHDARVAWYPSQEAWMKDGVVAEIRPARTK